MNINNTYVKRKCENDFLFFVRYLYKENHNRKFTINHHHIEIAKKLRDVVDGKIKRLIINIPP